MKTILVMNSKGGTGKTTIADEVGFWLECHGHVVDYVNVDGQPGLIHSTEKRGGADLRVVDMPGQILPNEGDAARAADLVIVPTQNSSRDREVTLGTLRRLARAAPETPVVLVFNRVQGRTRRDRALATMDSKAWAVANRTPSLRMVCQIPESVAVRDAAEAGVSVTAIRPASDQIHAAFEELGASVAKVLGL